ncbi:MAG: GTP-binding protein [Thermostichales cyanobacterium SZTDM-1c_bins_54]
MKRWQLWLGILVGAGVVVWVAEALGRLYLALAAYPWLANAAVLIILGAVLLGVGALLYSLVPRRPPPPAPPPPPQTLAEKQAATRQNLQHLESELAKISDQVTREALAAQAARLAHSLEQPQLRVVVFGTGSAGKTSLINALLGQQLGAVAATIGTTLQARLYRWPLVGIPHPVDLVDCPGILDMGQGGKHREAEARRYAQASDLLLFVVDGDLRQSEYEPLLHLAKLGKRALLIFNKADQYTPLEQELILQQLRERVRGVIAPEDVLLAAANPAAIPTPSGLIKPEPEVAAVRDRIHAILVQEGEWLWTDNQLLQSQLLGAETRQAIARQQLQQAEKVVERFQWIVTGVVFANPIPVLDVLAIAAINAQMVVELGQIYGCRLTLDQGKELALSLGKTLASLGVIEGAIQLTTGLVSLLAEVSVVGFMITAPIQAASAGYLTRIAGRSFITYFQKQQQWGEGGMRSVVLQEVEEARRSPWFEEFFRQAWQKLFQTAFRP